MAAPLLGLRRRMRHLTSFTLALAQTIALFCRPALPETFLMITKIPISTQIRRPHFLHRPSCGTATCMVPTQIPIYSPHFILARHRSQASSRATSGS